MKNLLLLLLLAVLGNRAAAEVMELGFAEGKAEGWSFSLGGEFPGAQGNFIVLPGEGPAGKAAGRLEGYFRHGGMYVAVSRSLPVPRTFREMRIRLRNAASYDALVVRLVDETGRTHQQAVRLGADREAWQLVSVRLDPNRRYTSWGGAKDGKWHGKLRGVSLLTEASRLPPGVPPRGLIYFDSIELELMED